MKKFSKLLTVVTSIILLISSSCFIVSCKDDTSDIEHIEIAEYLDYPDHVLRNVYVYEMGNYYLARPTYLKGFSGVWHWSIIEGTILERETQAYVAYPYSKNSTIKDWREEVVSNHYIESSKMYTDYDLVRKQELSADRKHIRNFYYSNKLQTEVKIFSSVQQTPVKKFNIKIKDKAESCIITYYTSTTRIGSLEDCVKSNTIEFPKNAVTIYYM